MSEALGGCESCPSAGSETEAEATIATATTPLERKRCNMDCLGTLSMLYLLQPCLVSSNPSNRRVAFAPASVSRRWGWPFSTVYRATVPLARRHSASSFISSCHLYWSNSPTYMKTHIFEIA